MNRAWQQLLMRVNPNCVTDRVLAIDPGNTLGYAYFKDGDFELADAVRIVEKDGDIRWDRLRYLFSILRPEILVMEEYRIYEYKAKDHSQSTIPTLRIIGGLQMYADMKDAKVVFQSASRAKGFCTDIKLNEWRMFGDNRHANDAIRHGCAFYLFHPDAKEVIKG